jgi:hypothetical protein
MVAETAPMPAKRPRKPSFGPGSPIPISTKLSVRSFYLLQGLKPSQIAPMVGLSAQQVANLAIREGWSKERTKRKAEKESKALERQDARAGEEIERIHQAIAIRGEELSVKTLDHCADLLSESVIDAKNLQMASGAARNFVQIARMSRGLDRTASGSQSQPQGNSVNLIFVGALERATPKELKQADAVNVSATAIPAAQIPDSAKPSPA